MSSAIVRIVACLTAPGSPSLSEPPERTGLWTGGARSAFVGAGAYPRFNTEGVIVKIASAPPFVDFRGQGPPRGRSKYLIPNGSDARGSRSRVATEKRRRGPTRLLSKEPLEKTLLRVIREELKTKKRGAA